MKKIFRVSNFTLTLTVTLFVLFFSEFFPTLERKLELLTQDLLYTVRGPKQPGPEVVIAAIDEKSLDKLGRWPWSREVVANLVDSLKEYKVKVFGFDVVFSSPQTGPSKEWLASLKGRITDAGVQEQEADQILAETLKESDRDALLYRSLKKSRKAVLGYYFHFSKEELGHMNDLEMERALKIISKSRYSGLKKVAGVDIKNLQFKRAYAAETSIAKISKATKRMGYFNFAPDLDGSVRKIPLIVKYRDMVGIQNEDDYLFPPLSMSILRKYLKSAILIWLGPLGVEKVALMGKDSYEIPTNRLGEMLINYYGPGKSFPHYSIADIINKKIPPEKLSQKIVLIGATAVGLGDLVVTPFDKLLPGVECHATVMDNILHNNILREPPWAPILLNILTVFCVGLILFFTIPRFGATVGGCFALGIFGLLIGSYYFIFIQYKTLFNVVPPLSETLLLYCTLAVYRFMKEEREKKYIQTAFGQYLSPAVIQDIIKDPTKLRLGGERREMTAFFSDIAGFTSISEKMSPEGLVELLNEALTEMSEILLKYDGTVDKYEGDAIVAFFGAPISHDDHALRCCLSAIDMQKRLVQLRKEWTKTGRPEMNMRIGINSGPMVVGNMGSKTRMDYTMMGDAVNLAARLEGVNKKYNTRTIISHFTYNQCKGELEVRELDTIRVVGKKEEITIYELFGRKGDISPEQQELYALYNDGLNFYKERQWEKAIDVFSGILDRDINEGPSLMYLERCLGFHLFPPDKNWDGVHVLKTK